MPAVVEQAAPGVHRIGSGLVNVYLVEEDGRYTVVDGGLPSHFDQLLDLLEALGADLHDVEAVVLTHGHRDNLGLVERVRTEAQARVLIHEADAQMARTVKAIATDGQIAPYLWRPAALRYLAHTAPARKTPRVEDLTTFTDGTALDVPGRPTAVGTPGHTYGHTALHLPQRGVLFAGDALCSRNPLTGRHGPQLMPSALNASTEQALASLDRIAQLDDAETVLFAHGDPWRDGTAALVDRARELAAS